VAQERLQIRLDAIDNTKRAFGSIKNSIFSLKGALAGLGLGLIVREFVKTGQSVEDLQVRLKQLFGSTQEGAKAFDVMSKFAARVPFSLEQIQAASGNLAVVAGDADRLSSILEITGNVAAVTGLDFQQTAEQIQRAFSGGIAAADVFREKGVRDLLGFSAGATISAEETIEAFQKVFGKGGRFGKATDELANTFTGTLSMLGDKLFNFKKNVAGAGFFDALKEEFQSLNKFIEENSADFQAIGTVISKTLVFAVKAFAGAVRAVGNATAFIRRQIENIQRLLGFDVPYVIEIEKGTQKIKETNKNLIVTKDIFTKVGEELKKQNEKFTIQSEIVKGIQGFAKGFSQSLAEALILGKNLNTSMRELAQQLLVSVVQKTIERIILLGIEKLLSETIFKNEQQKTKEIEKQNNLLLQQSLIPRGGFGGGMGGIFGVAKSIFGFAEGGRVNAGQPAIIGERGRELFIPSTDGQIIKNEDLGMGATINFTIVANDTKDFDRLLVERRSTITNIINQALNQRGKPALV